MTKKLEILDASEGIAFHTIYEAINDVIGTEYTGWMKACWPHTFGNGKFRLWFPKLAETRNGELVSAAFDCINTISDDWNEVVFDDLKNTQADMTKKFRDYDLIFAKEPYGDYIFRGVFLRDEEKSRPNHDVSKRIATRVKLIGEPVYDIELLDQINVEDVHESINTPIAPKSEIDYHDGVIRYECRRCGTVFIKAPRCPNCGQLIAFE